MKFLKQIRLPHLVAALLILALATGCPYASSVPISGATEEVHPDLVGHWVKKSEVNDENPDFIEITKTNEVFYDIRENDYSSDSYTVTDYKAHTTTIDGNMFFNMQKNGAGDYYLQKMVLDGKDEFTLFEVTDNIDEEFNSSAALKEFVAKNMNLSFFYNKDEIAYIRKDQ